MRWANVAMGMGMVPPYLTLHRIMRMEGRTVKHMMNDLRQDTKKSVTTILLQERGS